MTEVERQILEGIRRGLQPPTPAECDRVMAGWLFGKNAGKMLKYAPWSFALLKLAWKKGEEPWAS